MLKTIRIWMADMLITLAMMADFDSVLMFIMDARDMIDERIATEKAEREALERMFNAMTTPTKRGRPKGSKDTKPRVAREGVKLGRPKGRKDSVGKMVNGHA